MKSIGYSVSQQITSDLDFSCSNGEIFLSNHDGFSVPLDHADMQRLMIAWLKCTDIQFDETQREKLRFDISMRKAR